MSDTVVLSRFRSGLREDLRREFFVRDISTLEHAYQLVQDLDHSQGFSFTRQTIGMTPRPPMSKPQHSQCRPSPIWI